MSVTASHLKRFFANQDAPGSLERSALAGTPSVVSEEHETKDDVAPTQAPSDKQTTIIGLSSDTTTDGAAAFADIATAKLDDASVTPTAGILQPMSNPYSRSVRSSSKETEDDSDSTVFATHDDLVDKGDGKATIEPSTENDTSQFVSRLPRRAAPAPRYAILHFYSTILLTSPIY